ncbi:hypothetical protein [Ruminococcus sp.]|uniref:hypothetical protein n=1 Tax=Ruminococcus sp. TaxID=41978 RepID=UPI0015A93706|nr:hypothetical protein [Ruminococcus sp.]MEE0023705.1 hypothetical protein [Ruminococcus sp.]
MEKKKVIWTILTGIVISLVIVAGTLSSAVRENAGHAQEHTGEESSLPNPGYRMQIDGDRIALFRSGSSVPYQFLDTPLMLLSEADRESLEVGIEVQTAEEMQRLVEDMTS